MKGPGLRLTCDVRRVFQCPRCQRIKKTNHDATTCRCSCQPSGVWMKLLDKSPPIPPYPLTEQERECLIFRLEQSRPDPEMAEALQGEHRQRSHEGRSGPRRSDSRDRGYDTRGPRGNDRGPRPDDRREHPRDDVPEKREDAPQPIVPESVAVSGTPEPIEVPSATPPAPVAEQTPDEFGAGVE